MHMEVDKKVKWHIYFRRINKTTNFQKCKFYMQIQLTEHNKLFVRQNVQQSWNDAIFFRIYFVLMISSNVSSRLDLLGVWVAWTFIRYLSFYFPLHLFHFLSLFLLAFCIFSKIFSNSINFYDLKFQSNLVTRLTNYQHKSNHIFAPDNSIHWMEIVIFPAAEKNGFFIHSFLNNYSLTLHFNISITIK